MNPETGTKKENKAEAVLHVRREELRPEVRSYADNLKAQILDLLRKHDVKNVGEFESKARAHEIPEKALRELMELEKILAQVVRTNSLENTPESEMAKAIGEELLEKAREMSQPVTSQPVDALNPLDALDISLALARAMSAAGEDARREIDPWRDAVGVLYSATAALALVKIARLERELKLSTKKTTDLLKHAIENLENVFLGARHAKIALDAARLVGSQDSDFEYYLNAVTACAITIIHAGRPTGSLRESPSKFLTDVALLRYQAGLSWKVYVEDAKKYIATQDSAWPVRVQELLACARVEAAAGEGVSKTLEDALGIAARVLVRDTRDGVRAYIALARAAHDAKLDARPYIAVVEDGLNGVERLSADWAVAALLEYLDLQIAMGVDVHATHERIVRLLKNTFPPAESATLATSYARRLFQEGKNVESVLLFARESALKCEEGWYRASKLAEIAGLMADAGKDPRPYFEEAEEDFDKLANEKDKKQFALAYARAALRFFKYPYMQQVPAAIDRKEDE